MSRFYYKCKDVGFDCSYELNQPTLKDVWAKVRIHNRYAHNQFEIPPEWEKKIGEAIKEQ
ncbi:MAG: DUF1059 domain-containing protein [Candidatus Thermoplasmatota archaeon]|jgi:predicted small metal-binding protein|nr:DUF1059 domain-containing protein [Candidatus Thermoplasmatota archaeon]